MVQQNSAFITALFVSLGSLYTLATLKYWMMKEDSGNYWFIRVTWLVSLFFRTQIGLIQKYFSSTESSSHFLGPGKVYIIHSVHYRWLIDDTNQQNTQNCSVDIYIIIHTEYCYIFLSARDHHGQFPDGNFLRVGTCRNIQCDIII